MKEDAIYVLDKLGPHHQCVEDKYPELFKKQERSSSVYKQYSSDLTPSQRQKLKEIYGIDFKLFGYEV